MQARQRETRPRVLAERRFNRSPIHLAVAFLTIETQGALVRILVAGAAAARDQSLRRGAIVMAEQAGDFGVRSFQGVFGFLQVVKMEIGSKHVPALGDMTDIAFLGERFMRDKRTPLLAPGIACVSAGLGQDNFRGALFWES